MWKQQSSENDSAGGDNAGGSDKKACYHCRIPGNSRLDLIYYKRAKETRDRLCKCTASIATAGDEDLLRQAGGTLPASTATHSTSVSGCLALHNMYKNCSSFKSFKQLCQLLLIQLAKYHTVSVTDHGLVDATEHYVIHALYTPTFHQSLFSIDQLDSA